MFMRRPATSLVSGSRVPVQRSDQRSRAGKSQVSFGMRKPRLEVNITRASPIRPPSSDGNSGPSSAATAT